MNKETFDHLFDEMVRWRNKVEKLEAENKRLRAELDAFKANKGFHYMMDQVEGWQDRAWKSEKERDAWKELCGRWVEFAETICVSVPMPAAVLPPPEKPEGV